MYFSARVVGVTRQAGEAGTQATLGVMFEVVGHPQGVVHAGAPCAGSGSPAPAAAGRRSWGQRRAVLRRALCARPMKAAGPKVSVQTTVAGGLGLGELGKRVRRYPPRELARVDDDTAQRVAVATHVLGEAAPRCRRRARWVCTAQGGDRVVDDERHAAGVGRLEGRQIDDVAGRVADALAVDRLGFVVDEGGDGLPALSSWRSCIPDPEARQHVGKQVPPQSWGVETILSPAAVSAWMAVVMAANPPRPPGRRSPFQGGHPLFQHVVGGVR